MNMAGHHSSSGRHLDWSSDYFCGRENELETLRKSLDSNYNNPSSRCRIFFIQGEPGVGKSALVEQAFRDKASISSSSPPLIIAKAKFDDSYATMPLQVWMEATESILNFAIRDKRFRGHLYKSFQLSSEQSADYLAMLTSVLGDKLRTLFEDRPKNVRTKMPPKRSQQSFQTLELRYAGSLNFDVSAVDGSISRASVVMTAKKSIADKNYGFDRLKLAYREFFRIVCDYTRVVLVMDDIHWGEPDDFQIMETLLDDADLEDRLIFVATHRPVSILHGLGLVKNPRKRYSKTIPLSPFNTEEITALLHKLLNRSDDDLATATEVLEQKTGGNPFYLCQVLRAAEDQGMVKYSTDHGEWDIDVEGISNETLIGNNVLDVVARKMARDECLSKILRVAAFLGSTRITLTDLVWLMEEECEQELSEEKLHFALKTAVDMGWLDRIGPKEYRFAHDMIRESALTFLPMRDGLEKMHLQVGLRLRSKWERNPMDDRLLFQLVTQLNAGKDLIKTSKERLRLAQLNFQAAEAAIERAAFYPAVHFLRRTKEFLEEKYQVDTLNFALKTETALARMEYCCGLFERSISRADAIIKTARTDKERADAMHLKVKCLIQQKKPVSSLEVAIDGLTSFGVTYPRKFVKFQINRLFTKCKALLKKLSDEDVLNLPIAKEDRDQLASDSLSWIGEIALAFNGLGDHLTYCMLVALEMSIEQGRISMTGQALAAWGGLLAEQGFIEEAYRYGNLAMEVADERYGGSLDDRVPSLYYSWIHHLRHPYKEGLEPFSKTLKLMWGRGSLESVVDDTKGYLRLSYLSGTKLGSLLGEVRRYSDLCDDYGMVMARSLMDPFAQMVENLVQGRGEHMLRGGFMTETKSIKFWQENKSSTGIQHYYFFKTIVAYYYNSYELAGTLARKVTKLYVEGADNLTPYRYFFRALAAWTAYGLTKRSSYLKLGKKMMAGVENFVKAGMLNCNHSLLFLHAERAAAFCKKGRSKQKVQLAFDEAIASATSGGYIYDQALANERAGQYFMKMQDNDLASVYLERARQCYLDWGADGKALQMFRMYRSLMGTAPERLSLGTSTSSYNSKSKLVNSMSNLIFVESSEFDESLDETLDESDKTQESA